MVGGLVEEQHVGRRDQLAASPSRPRSPPLSLASGRVRACVGIEPEAVQHGVDARGERVAALPVKRSRSRS